MYRIVFQIFFALFLGAPIAGQSLVLPKQPLQQRLTGAGGQDELISLAVNWRGDIAAIGNAARGEQGGQDISFVVFDAQLNKTVERHLGRQGDDGVGQIAVLPDGRYLVAGFSTRPAGRNKTRAHYFGKKDGWLLVLDERGNTEREILLGTSADDVFSSVAVAADGSVWLAGNSAAQVWLVKLTPALEVAWERRIQYHQLPTHVTAAVLMPNGELFVTGGIEELNRKHLWVAGFDFLGQPIMEKIYPASQAENGTCIAVVNADLLAIVGTVDDPRNRENGFVSILDRAGVMRHYQPLGGREFDKISTLTRLHGGQLLAGGGSASFERGSRRISAWLSLLGADGKAIQESYYGSKLDDEVLAFAEHPDGRLFAVGTTARQVLKMRQGWLFQLSERSERKAKSGTLEVGIGQVVYPSGRSFLINERVFLSFFLKNNSEKGQCNLRAVVKAKDPAKADLLRLPGSRSVLIPPVAAGERLDWGLPLCFAEGSPAGVYQFQVQFFQENIPLGEPRDFEVNIGKNDQPRLEMSLVAPDSGFTAGREGFLLVEVRNTGAQTARDLTLSTSALPGIRVPVQVMLGDLTSGGKVTYRLPVFPEKTALGLTPSRLLLRVADGSLLHSAAAETDLNILAPVETSSAQPASPNYTVAVWVYPNPDNFDQKTIVWTQEDITVQVKIVSSQSVTRQQFCLEINGQPCQKGAKFDEVQIKGDRTSKTFSQMVRLREGENTLRAEVQTANGKISSEALKIVYSPAKPNLHIVSVGVPADDLKYTGKDARDFAAALASRENGAFGNIFLDTLLGEERTTKTEILKALRRLQYRYADLQIQPRDLLVIFVSGHGLGAYDGNFRLAASDYDGPFLQETSLDFEQEIVNYLQSLPCKKLFLVDACHSGTTSGTGLAGTAARKNGLNMLVSCQPDEFSYEDDAWQNGAFTRALVEGIKAFVNNPAALDSNADSALDVGELFSFIQKEVPVLVEKKRPKTKTSQHPHLVLAEASKPLVLFELKKR
ncbi:MAG: hypothetical protein OHK0019_31910 [Saprospiraceae bacterium]